MIEFFGDIWRLADRNIEGTDAIVITTNGVVKANGACVMGRGIAQQARDMFPGLDMKVGGHIREHGNIPGRFDVGAPYDIITMPVKPAVGPRGEPGWKAKADPALIEESAVWVVQLADIWEYEAKILTPRPGCGNGGLRWEDIKPMLERHWDDRFVVMHNPEGMS